MDRTIEKRSALYRYRFYIAGAAVLAALGIFVAVRASGGPRQRVKADNVTIAEVCSEPFLEYIDAECTVVPSLTIKVNTRESGFVARLVAPEGSMVARGDTIMMLENPALLSELADEKASYQSKLLTFREKELALQKSSLTLRQNILQARYELGNLENKFRLEQEEFQMGVKSPAQLENARNEYEYQKKKTELQLEMLGNDSISSVLSRELFEYDMARERRTYERSMQRLADLAVRAPIDGQLSGVNAMPGQQVGANAAVAEIKVLDPFRLRTSVSEHYIDRIAPGQPASAAEGGVTYPMRVERVLPEITDHMFRVEMAFTDREPENVRIGKSYRVQIELDRPEDAVVIPRGDFFPVTGGRWIYRLDEGGTRARRCHITIGRQNPRYYEVVSGLRPGDRVILTGYGQFNDAAGELILE